MPVTVPNESKVYTTTYENFKGVDLTNDASNVYRRRSPDGLNMLPDIDGSPKKRTGWEIMISDEEFLEAAGTTGTVSPIKTMYFTLGNVDHLAIFNSLGLFMYANGNLSFIDTYYADEDDATGSAFPPSVTISGATTQLTPDPHRSFFFEGQGKAGFYIYCGLNLFRYDADGRLYAVDPYIPTVLDGCDPTTGAGTTGENINLLTSKRTVTYFGNGDTVYVLPEKLATGDDDVAVSVLLDSGEWDDLELNTDYAVGIDQQGNSTVTFIQSVPPVATEANVKITYSPASSFEPVTRPGSKEFTCETVYRTVEWYMKTSPSGATILHSTLRQGFAQNPGSVVTDGLVEESDIKLFYNNSWDTETSFADQFTVSQNPYTKAMTITHADVQDESHRAERSTDRTIKTKGYWADASETFEFDSVNFGKVTHKIARATGDVYILFNEIEHTIPYRGRLEYTETILTSKIGRAFESCSRAIVFGSGLYNQVFFGASEMQDYNTRVWYSAATRPEYMPDLNYMEVGATDVPVAGFIKCDEYLGIVKQNDNMDSSIYLAYATSFDENTTYAIKQSIGGVGAISNGAFNILNGEPLFLSKNGIMGIELSGDFRIRNRSHYINRRLTEEAGLKNAISFVHKGLYYLAVNGHCYVLDGSQKSSWANEKTNLQYECYYLENIPAHCFARYNDELWFEDNNGNICRFKSENDANAYRDEYDASCYSLMKNVYSMSFEELESAAYLWEVGGCEFVYDNSYSALPEDGVSTHQFCVESLDELPAAIAYSPEVVESRKYLLGASRESSGTGYALTGFAIYTMEDFQDGEGYSVTLKKGVPITARWSTIADDDGAVHFFKNLQKKGCVVSLLPAENSGVIVYLKADENDPIKIGTADADGHALPYEFYVKKKVKKYKRLQIICENSEMDGSFGIDQIVKSYTIGNYSKNKG